MEISSLHPGLIFIAVGFIAALVPQKIRTYIMATAPCLGLAATLQLAYGTVWTVPFINGYDLYLLQVDRLNWIFALVFSIITVIAAIYSLHNKSWAEALAAMTYAGAVLGATLAGDWITLIFFWELMAIASLFLIWCNHTAKSRRAGFRYLLIHMFGGNLLLTGIFLKVSTGDFMIHNLSGTYDAAFWLIFIGISLNAAIPPLHSWLVDAYPEGTITGSIFLGSFTTKVAVYCLIRIFAGTEWLMWVGVAMALYGACYAIIENDMRRLLSYHIISQVGFMVAGVGIGTDMALDGATAHAFSKNLSKSLLFMCAGAIMYSTGIRNINQLGGMAKKIPIVFACFAIAAFSISGVPLFNGFISKSITISAAAEANYSAIELLLQLASVGTFLSITMKMLYFIFIAPDKGVVMKRPVPLNMHVAMLMSAALCTVYGVFPNLLYDYLPYPLHYQPFTVDHIVQYIQLLGVSMVPFMMYLSHMEPHTAISLDTDWFYRRPFAAMISGISSLCCAIQAALSSIWETLAVEVMDVTKNPLALLGQAPRKSRDPNYIPKAFDPDCYRPLIGETMMAVMMTLLAIIAYLASL